MDVFVSQVLARLRQSASTHPEWAAFLFVYLSFALGYIIVFQLTRIETLAESITGALINVIPLVVLSLAIVKLLQSFVVGQEAWKHFVVHPLLGAGFSFAWYFCVIVGRGVRTNWLEEGFVIQPFGWVGGTWQLYQGLALYGVAALFAYALHFYRRAVIAEAALTERNTPSPHPPLQTDNLIVKSDGEFVALDWQDIIFVEASGDDVVIHTQKNRTKTHRTLTSIAQKMPAPHFARIHRSFIANLDKVITAEPAGNGKLTLHMSDGMSLTTSRAGAQTFRAYVD